MILKDILVHTAACAGVIVLLLGLPLVQTGYLGAFLRGESVDSISSATTVLDKPSGTYVVFINKDTHPGSSLDTWTSFFTGGDFTYSFEDIACSVARGDLGAIDMAASFQSQLPENQMSLKLEDQTLLLSRMDNGKFDIVIMSTEFLDANPLAVNSCFEILKVGGSDT